MTLVTVLCQKRPDLFLEELELRLVGCRCIDAAPGRDEEENGAEKGEQPGYHSKRVSRTVTTGICIGLRFP